MEVVTEVAFLRTSSLYTKFSIKDKKIKIPCATLFNSVTLASILLVLRLLKNFQEACFPNIPNTPQKNDEIFLTGQYLFDTKPNFQLSGVRNT